MSFFAAADDSVLVVVDVQERLIAAMTPEDQATIARNVPVLVHAAKATGVPVLVTEQYPRGLGSTIESVREALPAGTQVVEKLEFSCSRAAAFANALHATGRRTVVLCGMEAHVCVLQTAHDLLQRGYAVHLAADAVSSRTDQNRQIGLGLARQMGAAISSTEAVAFQWVGRAGTDAFKVISRLVK
ncbi:MAG: hypothetical protein AMXMBFR64_45230 [Myxococcales bacterium]